MHGNYYFLSAEDPEELRRWPGTLIDEFEATVESGSNNWYEPIALATRDGFRGWLKDVGRSLDTAKDEAPPDFDTLWLGAARTALARSGLFDIPPVRIGDDPPETEDEKNLQTWGVEECRLQLVEAVVRTLEKLGRTARGIYRKWLEGQGDLGSLPEDLNHIDEAGAYLFSGTFPFVWIRSNPYSHAAFAGTSVWNTGKSTAILWLDIHT